MRIFTTILEYSAGSGGEGIVRNILFIFTLLFTVAFIGVCGGGNSSGIGPATYTLTFNADGGTFTKDARHGSVVNINDQTVIARPANSYILYRKG